MSPNMYLFNTVNFHEFKLKVTFLYNESIPVDMLVFKC